MSDLSGGLSVKIVGKPIVGDEIPMKRPTVDGVTLEDQCPKCGADWSLDLGSDYVKQYPRQMVPEDVHAFCRKCDHEWVAGKIAYALTVVEISDVAP